MFLQLKNSRLQMLVVCVGAVTTNKIYAVKYMQQQKSTIYIVSHFLLKKIVVYNLCPWRMKEFRSSIYW